MSCWCKGKGWYWVQNGPDDMDKEICDHCDVAENKIKELEDGYTKNGR